MIATNQKTDTLTLNNQEDIGFRFEKRALRKLPSEGLHLLFYPRATDLELLHKQYQGLVRQAQQRTWAPRLDYESFCYPSTEINKGF